MKYSILQLNSKTNPYTISFAISASLFVIGLLADYILKFKIPHPAFPNNIMIGVFIVAVILSVHFLSLKFRLLRWVRSLPASIASICYFTTLSVLMGLIVQNPNSPAGIHNIINSATYVISYIFILVTLGSVTIYRLSNFKRKDIAFALNHFGLWIVLFSAGLGSGDVQNLQLVLHKNEIAKQAVNYHGEVKELDFAVKLNNFILEEYQPKLAILNLQMGNYAKQNGELLVAEIDTGQIKLGDYDIIVNKFLPESKRQKEGFIKNNEPGAVPSANITIGGENIEGWVSNGSFNQKAEWIQLSETLGLIMTRPEAKRYCSEITVYKKSGEVYQTEIEVNKPIKINGWKLYQSSYDDSMGKWSEVSIIEVVKDPWLPIVYAGCYLMLLGAFLLIIQGKKKTQTV